MIALMESFNSLTPVYWMVFSGMHVYAFVLYAIVQTLNGNPRSGCCLSLRQGSLQSYV